MRKLGICEVTRKDGIRNKYIRGNLCIFLIEVKVEECDLRWSSGRDREGKKQNLQSVRDK